MEGSSKLPQANKDDHDLLEITAPESAWADWTCRWSEGCSRNARSAAGLAEDPEAGWPRRRTVAPESDVAASKPRWPKWTLIFVNPGWEPKT